MDFKEIGRYALLLTAISLGSCEKEIDIDYHEADRQYVVEASVSNKGTTVRISQTQAMDNNSTDSDISDATVVVTDDDGTSVTVPYKGNGFYTSSLAGTPGTTYQIDIRIGQQHFTSSSTMQRMPTVSSFRFVRKEMLSRKYIFGDIRLQDIPNEQNWYFVHIYRNGLGYRWAAFKDDTNPNRELQQLFGFYREDSSDSDAPREGDKFRIVVRSIDKGAYDYLRSIEQMDESGTNPLHNFEGGCLGYFSAHSELTFERIYHTADIEDDEE